MFLEVKELETKSVEGSSEWVELLNALEVAGGRFFFGGNHQDASNRINGWKSDESIPPSLVISFSIDKLINIAGVIKYHLFGESKLMQMHGDFGGISRN